ncbi:MAG: PEP/pyruvate-binding domain-containing protein [Candidatus Omnitrophica bacterium]|nr:PEP/pyruvate-binding domain-containing protein [Candidatus Omnitrophota bacterium]
MYIAKIKHPIIFNAIAIAITFLLSIESFLFVDEAKALAPYAGTEVISTRREMLRAYLERAEIIDARQDQEARRLLEANNADALLLSHGKIILSEKASQGNLSLLRAIIHEEIEATMQIMAREDRYKYSGLKELILPQRKILSTYYDLFSADRKPDLPADLLLNDIMAKAFELLILKEERLIYDNEITAEEKAFLSEVAPIVMANKHNYFTGVFWDWNARHMKIRVALANGNNFYQAADNNKKDDSETLKHETPEEARLFVDDFIKNALLKKEEWEAYQFYQAFARALQEIGVFYSYCDVTRGDHITFEEQEEAGRVNFTCADALSALHEREPQYAAMLFAGFDQHHFTSHKRDNEYYINSGDFLQADPAIIADVLRLNHLFQQNGQAIELTEEFKERWKPVSRSSLEAESLITTHKRVLVSRDGKQTSFLVNNESLPLLMSSLLSFAYMGVEDTKKEEYFIQILSKLPEDTLIAYMEDELKFLFSHSYIREPNTGLRDLGNVSYPRNESLKGEIVLTLNLLRRMARSGMIDVGHSELLKDILSVDEAAPPSYWHPDWEAPKGERLERAKLLIIRVRLYKDILLSQTAYHDLSFDKQNTAVMLNNKLAAGAYQNFRDLYGWEMEGCWDAFLDLLYLGRETAALVIRGTPSNGHAYIIDMFKNIMQSRPEGRTRLSRFCIDVIPDWSALTEEEFRKFYAKSDNPYDTSFLLMYFSGKVPHFATFINTSDLKRMILFCQRMMGVGTESLIISIIYDIAVARMDLWVELTESEREWLESISEKYAPEIETEEKELTFEEALTKARIAVVSVGRAMSEEDGIVYFSEKEQKFYTYDRCGDVLEKIGTLFAGGDLSQALHEWAFLSEKILRDIDIFEERARGKEAFVLDEALKNCRQSIAHLDKAFQKLIAEATEIKISTVARIGVSVGRLHCIDHTDNMHELVRRVQQVGKDDIAVARYFPTEYVLMNPNEGILSGVSEREGSPDHSSVLASMWVIPHAILPRADVFMKLWDGKQVLFASTGEGALMRIIDDSESRRYSLNIEEIRDQIKVDIPEADLNDPRLFSTLDTLRQKDKNVFGAKAARLGELKKNGMDNIPDGLAISFKAYQQFLETNPQIKREIEELVVICKELTGEKERRLVRIRNMIASTSIPGGLRREILDEIHKVFGKDPILFVRSSTNCEDLKNFSGAGLHDSYEFISGDDEILEHIQMVWASIWNLRAFDERERWNIDHGKVYPAVLLQNGRMSRKSFVVFTHHPETGKNDGKIRIWASYGLGRTLTDKESYPGEGALWIYDRVTGELKNKSPSRKIKIAVAVKNEGKVRIFSEEGIYDKVLTQSEAETVVRECLEIERVLGSGQDIEGGFDDNGLFIVQSRDVPERIDLTKFVNDLLRLGTTLPGASPEEIEFITSVKALVETSLQEFSDRAIEADNKSAFYEKNGQSLILYADDILENAIVVDLENTIKNILSKHNILSGGKIILFARNSVNASILERMLKRADPSLEVTTITSGELEESKHTNGSEAREVKGLVELAKARGAANILALIKGPTVEPESLASCSKETEVPVIVIGAEKALYSFAQAIAMAIDIKIKNGSGGWLIILPPLRTFTKELQAQYEEYRRSLHALQSA